MNYRSVRRRVASLSAVAVATVLLLVGCTIDDGGASPGQTTAPPTPGPSLSSSASESALPSPTSSDTGPGSAPPSTAAAAPSTAAAAPSTAVADPSATVAPGQTLATRDFTVTGTYTQTQVTMRFAVVELKRRGDLLDLRATLTNLEQDRTRDLRWQVAGRFGGSYRRDLTSTDGAFSGAVLTDLAAKKRYLVAADSSNTCVCTVQLSSTFVGAGQSIELNATYAAPPTTTTKLDVAVTTLGTFRDLPIS